MKTLQEYLNEDLFNITESEKIPTYYFGIKGEKLTDNGGKIRFIYTEKLDNTFSDHRTIKHGNSLTFRMSNGNYVVISPQHSKIEILNVIKQVFSDAKKIDSEKVQIESGYPHRGLVGDQPKINIKLEVYEINPGDVDWSKFNKLSSNLWVIACVAPYGIVSLDRPYVWDKFK